MVQTESAVTVYKTMVVRTDIGGVKKEKSLKREELVSYKRTSCHG